MYRLVFYVLIGLLLIALLYSAVGVLPFSPFAIVYSVALLLAVSLIANYIFSKVFEAPTNKESVYITAFILALIITPPHVLGDYFFLCWAAVLSTASKYIVAINKKHIFNPAAIAVATTAVAANQSASWWVGTLSMLPFVIVGGFLIARKLREISIVLIMIGAAFVTIVVLEILNEANPLIALQRTVVDSALFFFATIMFTEPLTMPPRYNLRVLYALLVGILFAPQIHIGSWYTSPEIALVIGNIYSYVVSPKVRRVLRLVRKTQLTSDVVDFVFENPTSFLFRPGNYMEWTLPHEKADDRGNRRYFTIASSPTESEIHVGVKFYPKSSSFKQALHDLQIGEEIVASQVAGDFVLPNRSDARCVFIAGGIGITPFRSMIQYLIDKNEKRDITLLYAAKTEEDFAYWELFEQARTAIGINTVYVPSTKGMITPEVIERHVPHAHECLFYISGPRAMVTSFENNLRAMGIARRNIKTDFFPGFA